MSGCHFGVTFDCGSAQMFLLLHLIDISITKLYGLLHLIIIYLFYLFVLSLFTPIFQSINRSINIFYIFKTFKLK